MEAAAGTIPYQFRRFDVRIPFAGLLGSYVIFGLAVLGFNRSPWQAMLTVGVAMSLDFAGNTWLRKRPPAIPWSGMITGLGLCLLLNYGAHPWLPILPAFLAIASKHVFTVGDRHVYNPTLFGLVAGGMLSGGLISPAPAYQWHGSMALVFVMVAAGCMIFVFRIKRTVLITSFLGFYMLQMLARAYIMRHHVPPEAIIFGTLSSPPFFLFTFYMLTDPATSPKGWKAQLALALGLTMVDFVLHTKRSYSTLFPALFMIQTGVLFYGWGRELLRGREFLTELRAWAPKAGIIMPCMGLLVFIFGRHEVDHESHGVVFTPIPAEESGFRGEMSPILTEVDERVQHIAKWVLSVGDAVATADIDGDGLLDVFLTQPLKQPHQRGILYHNDGGMRFSPIEVSAFEVLRHDPSTNGLPSCAVFADWDNDGDQDLFVGMGFGKSRLFRNEGECHFTDVTDEVGLGARTTCLAALFVDYDQDADLDLIVGNAMVPYLPDYDTPQPLNLFDLPEPEYQKDRRMFHFMHASWHQAENGGLNLVYRNEGDGQLEQLDANKLGMPQTHWTLALNAADFDHDGLPDIYAASDFGPDDLYYTKEDGSFRHHMGKVFGSVGKDTYKGMNCSLGDFDRNGYMDVYVSNVHAPLQAEGSLLWMGPDWKNEAAKRGALNERRFGWGAGVADLDWNGWPDIVQANGMVDDTPDKRFEEPRDYWYVNSRLARTGPEIHAYADKWGDIRGYSIWGQERNRVLLNEGGDFEDVSVAAGLAAKGNSRGVALADFDNGGDADLLITHQFKAPSFFRNDLDHAGRSWIGLELKGDGETINRDAVNAKVEVRWNGESHRSEVLNVTGFSSQGDRRLVFGLKGWSEPVEVRVTWRQGVETVHSGLEPNRYHVLEYDP